MADKLCFALFVTEWLPFAFLRLFFVPRLVGKSCKHRSDKGLRFTESASVSILYSKKLKVMIHSVNLIVLIIVFVLVSNF